MRILHFIIAFGLTGLLLPTTTFAEEPSAPADAAGTHAWSEQTVLAEYLTMAARNNPGLRAAFSRWRAAEERLPQADVLPDPKFTFAWFIQPVETRTGPQLFKYGLAQTLPWFGKRGLLREGAAAETDRLGALAEQTRLELFREIKKSYYEYAYLGRAIDLRSQEISLLQYLGDVIQGKYSAGLAPYSDVLKIEVELGRAENRLLKLKDRRTPLSADLDNLLRRREAGLLPLPTQLPIMVMALEEEELMEAVSGNTPRLAALAAIVDRARTSVGLAKKNFYPNVTFGLESIHTGSARNPGVTNADQDPIIGSVSFSIPLWQESRKAAVREAQANLKTARLRRQEVRDNLLAELQKQLFGYRDAGRRIDLFRNTLIPKAEQAFGAALEAFQTGTISSLDLLNAEKTFIELEMAYFRALTDQAARMADIEVLAGGEIPCEFHGSMLAGSQIPGPGAAAYTLE
ncbi:MAG TPA: TolC family protein [Desulfomicrobiaceae bacterium]|nr:TolC family protein [Desulfomicrobiaceae bacterium]